MAAVNLSTALRLTVVLFSAAVLERGLFAELRIAGVALDVLLLLAIAGGMALGPDRGAIVGFASGLVYDLLTNMPLGLSALVYCIVGFLAGRLYGETARSSRVLRGFLVGGLSVAGVCAYALAAAVLGRPDTISTDLVAVAVVVSVGNVVLAPLAIKAARWAWPIEAGSRAAIR